MIYNSLIKLPKVLVEEKTPSKVEDLLKTDDLDIGSTDELFKTQE